MKQMIRTAMMAAAMFTVVTTAAAAQGGGGGGGRGGMNITTILKDSLKVTDTTVLAKADSIQKAYATLNAPLMEAARGGDADARTKLTENNAKRTEAIKALLTDDQKAAYDKLMASMRGGRRGPPPTL